MTPMLAPGQVARRTARPRLVVACAVASGAIGAVGVVLLEAESILGPSDPSAG